MWRKALRFVGIVSALSVATSCSAAPRVVAATDPSSPLKLERIIPLPGVSGRIDHLTLDTAHGRLFVAEYGNGTVDEIDLAGGRPIGRIVGLHEPQGVAYLDRLNEIVVACGDGSVHFYAASDRREVAQLDLGDDADNVQIDSRNGHVIIGFGGGGLAIIDPADAQILSRVSLAGHPEGFRLKGSRAWINIPDRGAIVAYRVPAALQRREADTGNVIETLPACGDADDLFLDGDRQYLICGAGHIDVSTPSPAHDASVRVSTAPGARTGLFSPELEKLFIAVPARGQPAAIWILAAAVGHR
ncbi:hypothetical protein KRR38_34760 [Novosphingobium sp. G106]|uniref:YncE family protein n=1 Tax=Novosphingobium sp. G106 TaxID=2849500 RepID=UPI001C2D15BC|nr:hypothetical protein [Novosphingobium sp. G106]MBV1692656.1 hypothetical protein [Novosphingobium sp. G106]